MLDELLESMQEVDDIIKGKKAAARVTNFSEEKLKHTIEGSPKDRLVIPEEEQAWLDMKPKGKELL